ncbi:NOVA1 isoform 6, partial [Pan troglodytes]
VQLQKETGATIKLSKSKDFYPGADSCRRNCTWCCTEGISPLCHLQSETD